MREAALRPVADQPRPQGGLSLSPQWHESALSNSQKPVSAENVCGLRAERVCSGVDGRQAMIISIWVQWVHVGRGRGEGGRGERSEGGKGARGRSERAPRSQRGREAAGGAGSNGRDEKEQGRASKKSKKEEI